MPNASFERYKEKLKRDPVKWEEFLQKQRNNGRLYRAMKAVHMTPEELAKRRKHDRDRKRQQRWKAKMMALEAKGSSTPDQAGAASSSLEAPKVDTLPLFPTNQPARIDQQDDLTRNTLVFTAESSSAPSSSTTLKQEVNDDEWMNTLIINVEPKLSDTTGGQDINEQGINEQDGERPNDIDNQAKAAVTNHTNSVTSSSHTDVYSSSSGTETTAHVSVEHPGDIPEYSSTPPPYSSSSVTQYNRTAAHSNLLPLTVAVMASSSNTQPNSSSTPENKKVRTVRKQMLRATSIAQHSISQLLAELRTIALARNNEMERHHHSMKLLQEQEAKITFAISKKIGV